MFVVWLLCLFSLFVYVCLWLLLSCLIIDSVVYVVLGFRWFLRCVACIVVVSIVGLF